MSNATVGLRETCCRILRSRVGWQLAVFHASGFLFAIANMAPPSREFATFLEGGGGSTATLFAGRPFHFSYESLLLQTIFLLNLPSLIASIPIGLVLALPLKLLHLGLFADSYVEAALELAVATIQWMFVGLLFEKRMTRSKTGQRIDLLLRRHTAVIVAYVVLLSMIGLPIVNARSRRLGSKHGAISFFCGP